MFMNQTHQHSSFLVCLLKYPTMEFQTISTSVHCLETTSSPSNQTSVGSRGRPSRLSSTMGTAPRQLKGMLTFSIIQLLLAPKVQHTRSPCPLTKLNVIPGKLGSNNRPLGFQHHEYNSQSKETSEVMQDTIMPIN